LNHLHDVLTLLGKAGLSLKLDKCHFLQETVDYLGHVIRPGKLEIATKNTDALRTAQPPRTQTELRSFLGLCNVYRRFVPGFSKIAGPLNQMLRKGESPRLQKLSVEQLHAFESLRDKLLHPPVLALPRKEGRYILDTDASDLQIGSCLCQEHPDGLRHPIGYWSRSLNAAERNYSTTEKECLAIVWAILTLRPYLEGQRFLVRTDHHSLRWVLNLADAQGRLARWRLRLLEFDLEVEYAPGKEHHAADTMSRLLPPACIEPPLDTTIPCFATQRGTARACRPHRDYIVDVMPIPDSANDPYLVSLDDFRDKKLTDPRYGRWASQHDVELDDHGILGHILPSKEWSAIQPSAGHPVTVFLTGDELHAHEDARLFRR
jgi:RNase H-like domain found in reverse transcriptase